MLGNSQRAAFRLINAGNVMDILQSHTFLRGKVTEIRNETMWRYIDTISIRWVTIRIAAQHDISRNDHDIRKQGKAMHFHCIFSI